MFRAAIGGMGVLFLATLFVPSLGAADAQAPGIQWHWELHDAKNKRIKGGKFTVREYTVFHEGEKIGTYKDEGPGLVKVNFTAGPLKGKIELAKVKDVPPTWAGKYDKDHKVTVEFVKPRP